MWGQFIRQERLLQVGIAVAVLAYLLEHMLVSSDRVVSLGAALVLIMVIIGVAIRVAHHAEVLAEKVGEPYGTMILTLSAVLVEVIILVIMMSHEQSPTLARDTIYAAVMLDINGIVGVAALLGGLKHGEQPYNHDSGRSYIVMIITAMGISMWLPELVPVEHWPVYSGFTIGAMMLLYALFLRMQTGAHSYFFSYSYAERVETTAHGDEEHHESGVSTPMAVAFLLLGVILTGALAEVMSKSLGVGVQGVDIPPIFLALVVATISASPEILTAVRAALVNRMQPVINIALGASLSTVILTIPVVEAIALIKGNPIEMALTPVQTMLTAVTLLVAAINLNDGETNAIEGMTHFVLFAAFIMLSLIGL